MTRLTVVRFAVASVVAAAAFPLAAHASEPGPTPKTVIDTLTKIDKAKSEHAAPTAKKKLKGRQTAPIQPRSEYLPDQPWETDFYVENDIAGRRGIQVALASFSRRW
jgi:hypothetical protein